MTRFMRIFLLVLLIGSAVFSGQAHAFVPTITVTTLADDTFTDGLCSLREAITNANNHAATYPDCGFSAGGEIIAFSPALGAGTVLLGSSLPDITNTYGLTIDGGGGITIQASAAISFRVLIVNAGALFTLKGLTVSGGIASSCSTEPLGGGVLNRGTLTILDSTFTGNRANNYCASYPTASGAWVGSGGGVFNDHGTLTITNSIFSANIGNRGGAVHNAGGTVSISKSSFVGNSSPNSGGLDGGGGIFNTGMLSIFNSTFSGNSATALGGAILSAAGTATLTNNTFSGNGAWSGAGIYSFGATLNLYNNILANSTGGGDCAKWGGTVTANSNLIKDAANACGLSHGVSGNIIGFDPSLAPLVSSPPYFPINSGSLALDSGNDAICAAAPVNNTSQNGAIRPSGAHCDIGSFERDNNLPTVVSIVRTNPNPTLTIGTVHFLVTFSKMVSGVDATDFVLTTSGLLSGSSISGVSGSGLTYTVSVYTGGGFGTLRLDLVDNDTIVDVASNPLGGPGLGNGNFSSGESYTVITQPGSPVIGTATAGIASANVSFAGPFMDGGSAISSYTATSSPGGLTGSCVGPAACAITVNGLAPGTAYTFTVTATNAAGNSAPSAASNSVTPKMSQRIGGISFAPKSLIVGGSTTVSATASSLLGVSFSSNATPSICSVSGSTVTGLAAGTCTVAADQAGNATYGPAPQVAQNLKVSIKVKGVDLTPILMLLLD